MSDARTGWHRLCGLAEVKRAGRVVRWLGNKEVCALWREGRLWTFNSVCPHAGGPLGEGAIRDNGDPMLHCPWHGYLYNLSDGACNRHGLRLTFYPHRTDGDDLLVQLSLDGPPQA